jgi:hypothetical protein
MQSAIMLAGKALPDANPLAAQVVDGQRAQDVVAADLAYATKIISNSDTDVIFQVADRNNDGTPETIRFYWEGPGKRLVRVYNGVESTVAPNVEDFKLVYGIRPVTKTDTVTAEVEETTDRVLASYTSSSGTIKDFAVAPSALSTIEMKGWAAEYFKFSSAAPSGSTKVRFTKVDVRLKAYPLSTMDPTVGIYAAGGGATPVVGGLLGSEGRLSRTGLSGSAYTQVTSTLPSGATSSSLTGAFYVVIKGQDLVTPSAYLQYQTSTAVDTPHMEWTTNSGSTWQPAKANWNAQDLWFRVYGRFTFPQVTTTSTTTNYLSSVSMKLRASAAPESQIDTAVQVFNEPQLGGP